jgi:hypothetical protein
MAAGEEMPSTVSQEWSSDGEEAVRGNEVSTFEATRLLFTHSIKALCIL